MADVPLLEVEDLRVEFPTRRGTLTALDGVSFTIAPGEVLGVVGESGAGKSMTGAAIIGLLEPPGRIAGGQVRLAGRRIDTLPYEEMRQIRGREIGAIFQDPLTTLNPLYRIGDQLVETMLSHLPITPAEARRRAVEWLELVGIPAAAQRVDSYPHEFSGGMRQRVVIALLKRLAREKGTAMMLVTHDMGVIAETADRVAVMYAGRIAEIGPVREVVKHPRHPYSVGLMASIPPLDRRVGQLAQIEGAMPRLSAIPPGCPFNPRCPYAFDRCRAERPELLETGGTRAACWLYDAASERHVAGAPRHG